MAPADRTAGLEAGERVGRDAPAGTPGGPGTPVRRLGRRWMWALGALTLALCGVALGLLIADQVATNNQFDHTRASLDSTQGRLARVDAALATAHAALAAATSDVGNHTTALAQDTAELKGAQAALASAQAHVTAQSSLIGSLRTCLGGVTRALNALAAGKHARVLTDLHAVATSCSDAAAASG